MKSFEKGTSVEVIKSNPAGSFLQVGDQGETVSKVFEDGYVAVEFPFEFEDAHTCDGFASNGWFIHVDSLKETK